MTHLHFTPKKERKKDNDIYQLQKKEKMEKTEQFHSLEKGEGVGGREKERTEGGQAEKRTIPSSYVGECPGYK